MARWASVLGALRGISPEVATWRPYPDRHSIWALALHVAYWNYAVRRRIKGEKRGRFPRSPSNFPRVPSQPTKAAWNEDRRLVKEQHDLLVEAITDFDSARLDEYAGSNTQTTYADAITGIVLHDTLSSRPNRDDEAPSREPWTLTQPAHPKSPSSRTKAPRLWLRSTRSQDSSPTRTEQSRRVLRPRVAGLPRSGGAKRRRSEGVTPSGPPA